MKTTIKIILAFTFGYMFGTAAFAAEEYCYTPYGQPVIATHYVDKVEVTVHWLDQDTGAGAWSEWEVYEAEGYATCDIYVKRPLQPLGDPDMDALGHEVLHCFIGEFHD